MSVRRLEKISYADGVVAFSGHVLGVGVAAAHAPGLRAQRKYIRMDTACRRVNVL